MTKWLFLFFFLTVPALYAEDSGIIPMGASVEDSSINNSDGASPFIPNGIGSELIQGEDTKDSFVPGGNISANNPSFPNSDIKNYDQNLAGVIPLGENLSEYKKSEILGRIRTRGKSSVTISFVKDNFDYLSNGLGNGFDGTYRNSGGSGSKSSDFAALLLMKGQKYYYRGFVDLGYGAGIGVGYNGGRGSFLSITGESEEQSDAYFRLWSIPVDAFGTLELPIYHTVKLSFSAGPSFLGLVQYRSDVEDGGANKIMRQFSFGYAGEAAIGISMTKFSKENAFTLFNSYDISNLYLNFSARYQQYDHFKSDDLSISGLSFGVGLKFEYL